MIKEFLVHLGFVRIVVMALFGDQFRYLAVWPVGAKWAEQSVFTTNHNMSDYERQEQTPEQQAKIEKELDSMVTNWDERVETFDAMGLREELLHGIYSYGYERPSIVQQKCIMPLIRYVTCLSAHLSNAIALVGE